MKNPSLKTRGTTLVEIILYFTLLAIFLSAAMIFAFQISNVSTLSSNIHEIEYSSGELANLLTDHIQTAESVNTGDSLFDQTAGRLSLNMPAPATTPVVFYLQGGNVFIQEGLGDPVQINTPFVTVDELTFHHITSYKNPDQIVVDALFSTVSEDLSNVGHESTLHLTLSLRPY